MEFVTVEHRHRENDPTNVLSEDIQIPVKSLPSPRNTNSMGELGTVMTVFDLATSKHGSSSSSSSSSSTSISNNSSNNTSTDTVIRALSFDAPASGDDEQDERAETGPEDSKLAAQAESEDAEKSGDATEAAVAPASAETDAQRKERENRESEQMVWELMRQEAQQAYAMQMEFMRSNEHLLSQEDRDALQAAMQQSIDPALLAPALPEGDEDGEEGDEGDEEAEEEGWDDYERLLALGERIGDVKKDRWKMDAAKVIQALPALSYADVLAMLEVGDGKAPSSSLHSSPSSASAPASASTAEAAAPSIREGEGEGYPSKRPCTRFRDARCAVCMDAFSPDALLSLLPCTHYFHKACAAGWLASNNSCPCCKAKVLPSPQK